MTLKGRKNHFNVKMLSGYGLAVRLKDNKLVLAGGYDPFFGTQEKEEWFITNLPYEKIVISGRGYLSTEAISLLCSHYKNIVITDPQGHPVSLISGCMQSLTATKYRIGQYDTFRNPEKVLYLQKWILKEKIQSQIEFFKSLDNEILNDGIKKLEEYHSKIEQKSDSKELRAIEAGSGRYYFMNYAKLIPAKYGFQSRRGGGIVNSKRYAGDIINALLNYGYTVLAGEVAKFVNGLSLDPYYGFYHKTDTSFQALVYDLIEPFRWLVEYSVYRIANFTDKKWMIRKKDYTWTRDGNVVMDSDLIRRFLEILERKFQSERPYEFKHGLKKESGMSMCQEITISKINIQNLADFCVHNGKLDENLYLNSTLIIRSLGQRESI